MGKKKTRAKYTSQGLGDGISSSLCKTVRRERDYLTVYHHKVKSWLRNENPWITVESESGRTDKRFVRVRANHLWGNPKKNFHREGEGNDVA